MTSRVRVSILALAFAAFVAVPAVASAQAEFGVKAGVNMAKLSFEGDSEGVKSKMGLAAGVYVAKNIQNSLGFRVEALFSQKGAKQDAGTSDANFNITDIDVPLFLTVTPTSSSNTSFNFFVGPQFSLNSKAEFEFDGETEDAGDEMKGSSLAAVFGVGLKNGKISFDVRYAFGLGSIAKEGDAVKHRVISAMVGWQLK